MTENHGFAIGKSSITQPRIDIFCFKFGTEFDHMTDDVFYSFKVKGSKV